MTSPVPRETAGRGRMRWTGHAASVALLVLAAQAGVAQDSSGTSTSIGGFVDVYYAYCRPAPPSGDRSYTTQPLRHNEFSVNLAMIDVRHRGDRFRGRFALQTGTYVQANLAAEPPLLKSVLEASVGTRFGDAVWVDIGVFPSHIGLEGILSKDNWNYSRSMMADYSPYYETGISVTAAVSGDVTMRGLVLNGWQNIRETNSDKAVGTQVQYTPGGSVLLNWSTFIGNEQPDSAASRLRVFNDLYAVLTLSETWSVGAAFDIGLQQRAAGGSYDAWHAAALLVRYTIDRQWAVAGRAEYFSDGKGVLIPTGTPDNFQTAGGSVNIDYAPVTSLLWRLETRWFVSKDAVYPTEGGYGTTDGFVVLSAAIIL
jgi:hypothetical protein